MYGLEIKSERIISNPIIPRIVIRPPIFSFLKAMDKPIIELTGKRIKVIISRLLESSKPNPSPPNMYPSTKSNTNAKISEPHILAVKRMILAFFS